jgi:RNA polymerase sigma-70 factor (ECF subfamily)
VDYSKERPVLALRLSNPLFITSRRVNNVIPTLNLPDPIDRSEREETPRQATRRRERFYRLVWPHREHLLRTALILCGSTAQAEAEAEDLSQETLMRAFAHLDQFRHGEDARPWLMTILRRLRIDRLRSEARYQEEVSLDAAEIDPAAPETPDAVADLSVGSAPGELLEEFSDAAVIDALQQLPEDIRWTLLLADVHGSDHKEVAKVLDVPVGTVKSRVHRGRAMLRKTLLTVAQDRKLVRGGDVAAH